MTYITGKGTVWTLNFIFSLFTILRVSTSPKVKDNKRMVNVFLASISFWISEGEQEGVIHNPWPILLLKASWAKVINGKKNDRCSWPGRCESLIMEGLFKHPLGDMAPNVSGKLSYCRYVCKCVCRHLWRDQLC